MSPPTARHAPDQIPEQALAWVEAGRGAALATVTRTWGSAPRPVGAQLAVSSDAELAGSVSGGCVEGAVTAEALEAIEDGRPRMLSFGVSDDDAFAVGLPCGGEIEILVEPIGVGDGPSAAFLRELVDHRRSREAVIAAVNVETWERQLTTLAALPRSPAPETREAEAVDALVGGRSGYSTAEPGWFHATHPAPLRMVIVGAVHIAQALVPMARLAGFDVTVIDPRGAFATPARFPELDPARISQEYPGAVLAEHGLDLSTAVVCLTHDPKIDDEAIAPALASDAFYVGALGSTRTQAKRVERLVAGGAATEAQMARLHAPIGLDIGAKSPPEIAVAILAEIVERLRRPESRPGARRDSQLGARAAAAV